MKSRQSTLLQSVLFQSALLVITLGLVAMLAACGGGGHSTPPPNNATVSIGATSGTPQSAMVGTAFGAPLVATVTTGGTPTSGVTVTFAAPASGASGTFAGGANTATTNASGVATSAAFTANSTAGAYVVTASVSGASAPANFNLTNTAAPVESIAATSGTPQSALVGAAFGAPLVATVTTGGTPNSGVAVTFTAPASGAGGTFATTPPSTTAMVTTGANGVATSPAFTANATPGLYTVTASASGVSTPVGFNLTNTTIANATLAAGNYTFWLAGTDANNGPYYVAGAITVAASGGISAGEQDFIDLDSILTDSNISGSFAVTADGNLQITLNTGDLCIGPGASGPCGQPGSTTGTGVETLNATLTMTTPTSGARITEFDTWATGSGQLEPQSAPTSTPISGYAFSVAGLDGSNPANPLAVGGVINVDSSGGISGTGSVFDENDGGTILQAQTFAPSTVTSTPDSFGRVIFTLNPSGASGVPEIVLVGYFVNSSTLRLVETSDNLNGTTDGQALVQTGTGSFGTSSFKEASYIFETMGADNAAGGSVDQVAGVLTGNADGTTVNGNISFNDLTNISPQGGIAIAAGTYTVDPTGRVTLAGLTDNATFTFNLQLYLDGNGNARVLSVDSNDVIDGLGQSLTASTFGGTYAVGAVGVDPNFLDEFDAVGPVVTDGSGNFAGFVDLNWIFSPSPGPTFPNSAVSGTNFTATATPGISTGNITGIDVTDCQVFEAATTTGCTDDLFTYYIVNSNTVVGIENDANQLTLIRFELQQ
jgi:hypothetical protein